MSQFSVSIVIPLFNEIESLPHLLDELDATIREDNLDAEVLIIDDGSRDGSRQFILDNLDKYNFLSLLSFRLNKGKSAALDAGFQKAKGDYVVTMDADLQDDPREVKNLIEKLDEGKKC